MEAPATAAAAGGGGTNATTAAAAANASTNGSAPPAPAQLGKAPFGSLDILGALTAGAGSSGDFSYMLEAATGLEPDVATFVSRVFSFSC